jgi:hypothetical protein
MFLTNTAVVSLLRGCDANFLKYDAEVLVK